MPIDFLIDFLTEEQKKNYGRYAAEPNEVQLSRYFILDENDLTFIAQRRGDQNRLGIALQLTSVRFLGAFLSDLTLVPRNVQTFVARQLSISRTEILAEYAKREPTRWEHYAQIKKYYHYHEFGEFPWTFRLNRLLYTRAWISNERPSLMFDFATAWLVQHKILLPGATTLTRVITEIRERAANRLWQRLLVLPNDEQKQQLGELLSFSEGQRVSMFERLKRGPVTISSPAFNDALDRYNTLHQLGFQQLDFTGLPPAQLKSLARYANVTSVKKIARMPMKKRTAILIAFVKSLEVTALDEAIDVLDMLITNIAGEAKKAGQKKRLRTLKDLDRSSLMLAKACALLLDEITDDVHLRKSIFSCVPKERLAESVKMVNELARPADNNFHDEMIEQYGRVRRFLPRVLRELTFRAAPAGEYTLAAFNYLSSLSR